MASSKPQHVYLFKDDYQRMSEWVLRYPNIETGGQLFGLFTTGKCPYIQIVIGPGGNCRHESHSFHQDIPYLTKVGKFLNEEYMMCHIGEWHSHHKLRLRQPSHGDVSSVLNHFPQGFEYFILIIATIEPGNKVRLWPWLFDSATKRHEEIKVKIIERDNVFMKDSCIKDHIEDGAELYDRWYTQEKYSVLLQLLNSELERIADNRKVEITSSRENFLCFSLERKQCSYTVTFEHSFARANIKCSPPKCSQPQYIVDQRKDMSAEDFCQEIVDKIRKINIRVIR